MSGSGDELEAVAPEVIGRCAWEVDEARRDVEVLAWIGRFRFVTAQAIGERFGVSWQRANARVRRLERLGLVGCERAHVSQPRAVFLTGRGHELLGGPRRRAPRAEVQREHEAAIVWLVTELERAAGDTVRVLTERECRRLEAGETERHSVVVTGAGATVQRRWPDLVVEVGELRRAIEIEFAPKGSRRLEGIVVAYEHSSYDEAVFFVRSAALGRRIKRLARSVPDPVRARSGLGSCAVRVLAWPGLPADERERLDRRLAA
ncbi:MAG TPA: helix-turn-helix domain-containing protein [Solirubrobacteraceae bacterium]|nr:helix-turn-helix domain-containing protein [Solirubrobacteraceae bacterium]